MALLRRKPKLPDGAPAPPSAEILPLPAARAATREPQALPRGRPTLSCVVPCHNEAESLPELLPRLERALSACSRAWEIIFVDDGSSDGTERLLAEWTQRPGLRALQLSRNFGKEAALTAGLAAADGEVVVTMDADLQHEPELIPEFVSRWREGVDVAYAQRAERADEPLVKRVGTRWFYRWVNAGGRFELPADAGDFRLMDRQVVDALLSLPERNRFMKGLYAWVGFKSTPVRYMPPPRLHGRTHFSMARLARMSIDGLTAFTTWPLRAAGVIGLVLAVLAFVYGVWLIVSYLLFGHAVSGWTTIVVSLMVLAGMVLSSLGVVGEYVGRIFEEVKARPVFVVRRELGRGLKD